MLLQTSAGLAAGLIVILVIRMVLDRGSRGCCCLLFGICIRATFLNVEKTLKIQTLLFLRCKFKHGVISPQVSSSEKVSIYFRAPQLKGLHLVLFDFYLVEKEMPYVDEKSVSINIFFSSCGK